MFTYLILFTVLCISYSTMLDWSVSFLITCMETIIILCTLALKSAVVNFSSVFTTPNCVWWWLFIQWQYSYFNAPDLAQHYLVKNDITAIRRIRKTDNNRIARACGATIVNRTEELKEEDVGTGAGLFEISKFGDE